MTDLYLRDLVPIVELQAVELKRLMRDKERLNQKVDSLISEIGSLRVLQQRDQTLRAREQDLRAKMQQALADLVSRTSQANDGAPIKPSADVPMAKGERGQEMVKPGEEKAAVTKSAVGAPQKPIPHERMEIPAFLASGPRVGFDQAVADDIREIHGPGGVRGEAPIKKLLDRIRARNGAR